MTRNNYIGFWFRLRLWIRIRLKSSRISAGDWAAHVEGRTDKTTSALTADRPPSCFSNSKSKQDD